MIEIRINNIDEVVRVFGKLKVKDMLNNALRKSVYTVERTAKENTPVRTGLLRNSYDEKFSDLRAELLNYREYAPYVEARRGFLQKSLDMELDNVELIFVKEVSDLLQSK